MVTQAEAIIEAFESLGKDEPRTIKEIADWVSKHFPNVGRIVEPKWPTWFPGMMEETNRLPLQNI